MIKQANCFFLDAKLLKPIYGVQIEPVESISNLTRFELEFGNIEQKFIYLWRDIVVV
jgi:hypothetical protein